MEPFFQLTTRERASLFFFLPLPLFSSQPPHLPPSLDHNIFHLSCQIFNVRINSPVTVASYIILESLISLSLSIYLYSFESPLTLRLSTLDLYIFAVDRLKHQIQENLIKIDPKECAEIVKGRTGVQGEGVGHNYVVCVYVCVCFSRLCGRYNAYSVFFNEY